MARERGGAAIKAPWLSFPPFMEERKTPVVATLEQLAALVRGRLVGDGSLRIRSARPVREAGPGDITFLESERFAKDLRASPASAAIVGPHFSLSPPAPESKLALIEVDDPMSAFLTIRTHLSGGQKTRWCGIHPQACVAPTAVVSEDVAIHAFAYVGTGAQIGAGSTLHPGAVVSDGCILGRDCILHPNVVLYENVTLGDRVEIHSGTVLGGDGFGYRQVSGRHVKVPHTGRLEVESDVEIGANCTIDRATFETTRIGEGTKIDNLVMIGHNNQIGRHNLLCGQVGIAGSCRTGDHVVMAGQAGIKDNTQIGSGVIVGAQAGVHRNIPDGQNVLGSPAIPVREQRRLFQTIARLPDMHRQLKELTAQVAQLMAASGHEQAGALGAPSPAGQTEPSTATTRDGADGDLS
jgi:UDP-3-O-[3-hydroxymyristoyl] glucosamine N-acyltransferase